MLVVGAAVSPSLAAQGRVTQTSFTVSVTVVARCDIGAAANAAPPSSDCAPALREDFALPPPALPRATVGQTRPPRWTAAPMALGSPAVAVSRRAGEGGVAPPATVSEIAADLPAAHPFAEPASPARGPAVRTLYYRF